MPILSSHCSKSKIKIKVQCIVNQINDQKNIDLVKVEQINHAREFQTREIVFYTDWTKEQIQCFKYKHSLTGTEFRELQRYIF